MIVLSPPVLPPAYVFTSPDVLTTTDNDLIPWVPGRGRAVSRATAQVKAAPDGDDIEIVIKVITRSTGATAATLGTLTIVDGDLSGDLTFASRVIAETEALAAEVSQVGSTDPGENLTVQVS